MTWVLYKVINNGSYECDSWHEITRSQDPVEPLRTLAFLESTNTDEDISYAIKFE